LNLDAAAVTVGDEAMGGEPGEHGEGGGLGNGGVGDVGSVLLLPMLTWSPRLMLQVPSNVLLNAEVFIVNAEPTNLMMAAADSTKRNS